jgi:hypothetical protein
MTLGIFFLILLMVVTGAVSLFVNYIIFFIWLPMIYRLYRDQFRRIRERRNSKPDTARP